MDLTALADSIGEAMPLDQTQEVVPGRVLSIDADMLAYQCGGNEETTVSQSREWATHLIHRLTSAAGAEKVMLHLTGDGSTKGDRYLVAQRKPYQGNRKSGRKPHNHGYLRDWMATGQGEWPVKVWLDREADDGICYMACHVKDHWIATRDKDMRMIPGGHVNWQTGETTRFSHGTYDHQAWGLQFGLKWFWMQMLMGDKADNIPNVTRLFGEAKACKALLPAEGHLHAYDIVVDLYEEYHGDKWADAFVESASLLWMRTNRIAQVAQFLDYMPATGYRGMQDILEAADRLYKRVNTMKEEACQINDLHNGN